jgi:CheY-like chemotaxis protein
MIWGSGGTFGGKTAFIVDDDEVILRVGALLLKSWGLTVRFFQSAQECLAAAAAHHPDCIVSDLQMPGMDGADLIRALRSEGAAVPVIIVTSADECSPMVKKAEQAGAYRVVPKAHYQAGLLQAISELFGESESPTKG